MSKTSIIAMTSEFDTRIIKTFTAYHSMHVKVLLIAFDLQYSFYTGLYSKGICNCTDLYAEGEAVQIKVLVWLCLSLRHD